MKTRWYFIIAGAAVLGFAAWYQDFHRQDTQRRQELAAAQSRQRAAEAERLRVAQIDAAEQVRKEAEARRQERELRAQNEALGQARRDDWQSQLTAVREENAALRVSRERLVREIAAIAERGAAQEREQAAISREQEFLKDYITKATASAARIEAVAEKTKILLAAAPIVPSAEPVRRPR